MGIYGKNLTTGRDMNVRLGLYDGGKEILMSSTKLLHWIFYVAFSVCLTFAALQIGGYAEEAPELKENSWRYSDGEALILDSP